MSTVRVRVKIVNESADDDNDYVLWVGGISLDPVLGAWVTQERTEDLDEPVIRALRQMANVLRAEAAKSLSDQALNEMGAFQWDVT